ncbi:hypothetical protein [Streptomyces ochraceiscleroticus]|uniref:Uncharacterized protein n=1 Tax=Streptomyces ochraceiscleroticus TaxID=47761 RepID=A0ABW1MT83_9ACTN|nr:hypothetical protein [Streptomyces ochraceiscleroticus]
MPHPPEPAVAFGRIPDLGVAAAVADDRPFLDEVLRRHGFEYSPRRDIYLLPPGTAHDAAVQTVAAATQRFQGAGLSVAADPRLVVPPASSTSHSNGPASGPSQGRPQNLQTDDAARARAATASSPHRPIAPARSFTPEAAPPSAVPQVAARRHR